MDVSDGSRDARHRERGKGEGEEGERSRGVEGEGCKKESGGLELDEADKAEIGEEYIGGSAGEGVCGIPYSESFWLRGVETFKEEDDLLCQ